MRVADMHLRGRTGRLVVRVYSPHETDEAAPLLVLFGGAGPLCAGLCELAGVVVLAIPEFGTAVEDATAVLEWAADHAAELGADPARLRVAGQGGGVPLATAVAARAREAGWPEITKLVLLESGRVDTDG